MTEDNFFKNVSLDSNKSNFKVYRKEALEWIQQLSGNQWSDYNIHDPGITILEVLCYVLTELDYKLGFSIEDILASSSGEFKIEQNAMFMPDQIFKVAPVTISDYRKILLDRIEGVNDVWIRPNKIEGYDISLVVRTCKDDSYFVNKVKKVLEEQQSLGVCFKDISIVERKECTITLNLEIGKNIKPEKVISHVFKRIESELLDSVSSKSNFSGLKNEGWKYEEIYDGPSLNNGVISSLPDSLQNVEVDIYDVKKIILNIEGVNMVNELVFHFDGESYDSFIPIENFVLSINYLDSNFYVTEKDGPVDYSLKNLNYYLSLSRNIGVFENKFPEISKGRDRNISQHISIKEEFPKVYFADVDAAKQFEGFLKLFDLFFEDKLTVIAQLSNTFSIINSKSESFSYLKQRDSVLNHLLSRFSIYFFENVPYYFDNKTQKDKLLKHQIECKEEMLKDCVYLTSNRNIFSLDSVSALEKELYLKLWISKKPKKPLFEIVEKHFDKENSNNINYLKYILKAGLSYEEYELKQNVPNNSINNIILNKQFDLGIYDSKESLNIIKKHIKYFKKVNIESEGFYLIPNKYFDISYEANFELTFVFSGWSNRFQSSIFRNQVIRHISNLVSAHMGFRCVWLDYSEMKIFEKLYLFWIDQIKTNKESRMTSILSNKLRKMLNELENSQSGRD